MMLLGKREQLKMETNFKSVLEKKHFKQPNEVQTTPVRSGTSSSHYRPVHLVSSTAAVCPVEQQ